MLEIKLRQFVEQINSLFDVVCSSDTSSFNGKEHKELAVAIDKNTDILILEREFKLGVLSSLGINHEFDGWLDCIGNIRRYICWRVLPEFQLYGSGNKTIYCRFSTGEL